MPAPRPSGLSIWITSPGLEGTEAVARELAGRLRGRVQPEVALGQEPAGPGGPTSTEAMGALAETPGALTVVPCPPNVWEVSLRRRPPDRGSHEVFVRVGPTLTSPTQTERTTDGVAAGPTEFPPSANRDLPGPDLILEGNLGGPGDVANSIADALHRAGWLAGLRWTPAPREEIVAPAGYPVTVVDSGPSGPTHPLAPTLRTR